jgi:SprT protein
MGMQDDIKSRTFSKWAEARRLYPVLVDMGLPLPLVTFDVRGTTAGKAYYRAHRVAFNLKLAEHVGLEAFQQTITHEVAHLVTALVYGKQQPHGWHWARVMEALGARPERCHSYDVSTVRVRRNTRTCKATCGCREHDVTPAMHAKLVAGVRYRCGLCKGPVRAAIAGGAA